MRGDPLAVELVLVRPQWGAASRLLAWHPARRQAGRLRLSLHAEPLSQEDPVGLAGGLNAYGFAAGDPINFGDPFGLHPCQEAGNEDHDDYDVIGYNPDGSPIKQKTHVDCSKQRAQAEAAARTPQQCFTQSTEPVREIGGKGLAAGVALGSGLVVRGRMMIQTGTRAAESLEYLQTLFTYTRDIWPSVQNLAGPLISAVAARGIAGAATAEAGSATATAGTWVLVGAGGLAGSYLLTTAAACVVAPDSFE